jgi:hypothetical protein
LDIGILLLIVFILAPLLEKLLAVGRPKAPPQEGPPQQAPRQPRQQRQPRELEERPFRTIPSADADADEQSAAAMLPDDLWEILTGEKRPQRLPRTPDPVAAETLPAEAAPREVSPPRRPDPRPDREARRAERPAPQRRAPTPPRERRLPEVTMRRDPAEGRMRAATPRDRSPPDDYVREIPVRDVPVVVPYDEPSTDARVRRAAFHDRRGPLSEAAVVQRGPGRSKSAPKNIEELRRAIIMNEVLGRPRGLE